MIPANPATRATDAANTRGTADTRTCSANEATAELASSPGSAGRWSLDEPAYAGPEHLDRGFVAGYDRKQGYPDVGADLAVLREQGVLTSQATVVDLGAGTGRFALAAAAHCRRVVAVDVSPAMIEHLRRAAGQAGVSNIECVRAGFLSYRHEGA